MCRPAIALMNRLRYSQKFVLVSVLFAVPLSLMLVLLVSDIHSGMNLTQSERVGTRYLRPLRQLLEYVPELGLQEHLYASGITPGTDKIIQAQAQVESAVTNLGAIDQEIGSRLGTTSQYKALLKTWDTLRQRLNSHQYAAIPNAGLKASSDDIYTRLSGQLRGLMTQVGDSAYLVLDNDIAGYYMINTLLANLPETQDAIARARLLGQNITAHKIATIGDRTQLATFADTIQANSDTLKRNMDVAFRSTSALQTRLGTYVTASTTANAALVDMTTHDITEAPLITRKSDEFLSIANSAQTASFSLWDQSAAALDDTLSARLDSYMQRQILVIGVACAILLVVAYLLLGFYLSVSRTVGRLADASRRMIDGTAGEMVALDNRDELGQVVKAFNNVATALISTSMALQDRQETSETISQNVLQLAAQLKKTANMQAAGSTQQVAMVAQVDKAAQESSTTAVAIAELAEKVAAAINIAAADSQMIETTTSRSTQQSEQGMAAVGQTITLSEEGAEYYQHLLETMQDLTAKGANMRRILDLLAEISDETHLLSLNAAIEAAGAGENGQRFGVIAQEVKNLADRSGAASKEVVGIVQEIEKSAQATLNLAINGYQKAQNTAEAAGKAGHVIQEMLKIATESQDQAVTISRAAQEARQLTELIYGATGTQRIANQNVRHAVTELSSVARESAESSTRISDTAVSLENMAHTLNAALISS